MTGGKISVIIPCYNVEKYIDECLESVISQSVGLDRLEIILVDDASTDSTVDKIKEFEKLYPDNVMVILCDKNGRQGTARNIGMSYATGEYISFVDSDDWIHPDMYSVLINIMDTTECDIVQFRYSEMTKEKPKEYYESISDVEFKLYDYGTDRKKYLLNSSVLNESCTTKLYRKSLLDRAGVKYAEGVAYEEPLFTYPLKFYVNKVAVTEEILYYYRINESGTMISYMSNPSTMLQHLQVQQYVYIGMQGTEAMKNYKDEIDFYFIHSFYAETFYFMAMRGMAMPIVMLRYMIKTLKEYIPDYRNNPYISRPELANEMLSLEFIDKEQLDDKELEESVQKYMHDLTL